MGNPKTKKRKEVEEAVVIEDMAKPKMKKRKEVEEAVVIEDIAKPKMKKRKEVEEAVVIEDMAKPKMKERKEEDEEAGSPRGSAPILPHVKKVRFATAPDKIIPDKRNMDDLWQAAFPVGTEWDKMDSLYEIQWDFSNLENAFEEGGPLYGKKVYLFGCTEPQLVPFENQLKVVHIPVTVAVVSSFPPSDKIGIKSVQMEGETIVPMKEMKMDWVPYVPFYDRNIQVEHLKTQIYTLQCMQRRASLKQLKREHIKKYEYCLPYFYQPLKEDEIEEDTVVQIMYPTEPPVVCDFDWELDDIEEFADNLVQDEVLTEDSKEDFKVREDHRKAIGDMSPETKAAFENIRFYKFYPVQTPNTPDISKVKVLFINRYYGKAHEVW